ncbi:hypothetical protein LY76DRAFT_266613 [Colletotrichum caudatum]|nr:hypothetical protein LY76DRAFT_266613 [Colletotrichum caudatum]
MTTASPHSANSGFVVYGSTIALVSQGPTTLSALHLHCCSPQVTVPRRAVRSRPLLEGDQYDPWLPIWAVAGWLQKRLDTRDSSPLAHSLMFLCPYRLGQQHVQDPRNHPLITPHPPFIAASDDPFKCRAKSQSPTLKAPQSARRLQLPILFGFRYPFELALHTSSTLAGGYQARSLPRASMLTPGIPGISFVR